MGLFTEAELNVLDAIAANKKLTDADREHLPTLREKLGATGHSTLVAQFVARTGWVNRPKDYSV